jgi:hypothetical protein
MAEHEYDEFIEGLASELRRPVRFDASFDASVMAALEAPVIPIHRVAKSRPWLLRPRTFSLTPLGGLAAAAALAGLAALGTLQTRGTTPPQAAVTAPVPVVPVAFDPLAPQAIPFVLTEFQNAKSVTLVGDFNEWDAHQTPLELKDGVWSASVELRPGRYQYQFVVDGKWIVDPAGKSVPSDFGGSNSVLTVRPGGVR